MLMNRVGCKVQVSAGVLCNPSGVQTQGREPLVCIINSNYLITFIKSFFLYALTFKPAKEDSKERPPPLEPVPVSESSSFLPVMSHCLLKFAHRDVIE